MLYIYENVFKAHFTSTNPWNCPVYLNKYTNLNCIHKRSKIDSNLENKLYSKTFKINQSQKIGFIKTITLKQ